MPRSSSTPRASNSRDVHSIACTCTRAYAWVIGNEAIRGTVHGLAEAGIASRRLIINDAKALVHTVNETAYLVSPGVFQRYAQEHPEVAALAKQENQQDWQWVQKRFEKLQLHRKQPNGLNIWTCEVTGPRKSRRLHGYLLEDGSLALAEIPPNNPYLALTQEG